MAPRGSIALRCWPYGQEYALRMAGQAPGKPRDWGPGRHGVEVVLPLLRPEPAGPDYLRHHLQQLTRNGRRLPPASVELLHGALSSGAVTEDGLPIYEPRGPEHGGGQEAALLGAVAAGQEVRPVAEFERREIRPGMVFTASTVSRAANRRGGGRSGQRDTAPLRSIYAAVAGDVLDMRMQDVGRFILRQQPGKQWDAEDMPSAHRTGAGAYARRAEGREWLAQLGCWPWASAERGKLPRRWREEMTP